MRILIFGLGYSASYIAQHLQDVGIEVTATVRTTAKAEELGRRGITARVFSSSFADPLIVDDIKSSDAILSSVPPSESGDPVLASFTRAITSDSRSRWIGYLSTIGVYGDHLGNWVDETTAATSEKPRSQLRIAAEQAWLALGAQVFRLSGIYGPGRNQLEKLAAGTATRIIKPGQVFNRIHVADIAAVVAASLSRPRPGAIYNVTDNEPAPPQQVVEFAAKLCGRTPPPEIAFEHADLSPMARSFYLENCRVRNDLIRTELGVTLAYPSYREGLSALRALGEGPA
ncbi:NAD(P)-dependent oxidoreductase [Rhodopseudomonas palustris]|uniref:SDR family oxidoreductase n=1 Tax=Rhodopseudomonas palustris TaxID=1076 RepID=UPI000D1A4B84|nr:SDR family oxidoreductase [Rhodopseudomonas palustris]AVT77309.1 NAD(P)-dependent oxidoreductase [Rhodopseudomonas palustris]